MLKEDAEKAQSLEEVIAELERLQMSEAEKETQLAQAQEQLQVRKRVAHLLSVLTSLDNAVRARPEHLVVHESLAWMPSLTALPFLTGNAHEPFF